MICTFRRRARRGSAAYLSQERITRWPVHYPIAGRDQVLAEFMNDWIVLKKGDGTIRRAYDHWILGRTAEQQGPRWSIIRDVLHWVE